MLSTVRRLLPMALALLVPALLSFGASALAQSPSPSARPSGGTASPSGSASASATGQATGGSSKSAQGDPSKGQTLYQTNCTSCHGANMEGGVGPKLNPIEKISGAPSNPLQESYLIDTITKGKSGDVGVMPPKGGNSSLSTQDIKDITAYIIQQNKTTPGGLSPRELAVSNVEWIAAGILALLLVTWLLARYNMRWVARRARRG